LHTLLCLISLLHGLHVVNDYYCAYYHVAQIVAAFVVLHEDHSTADKEHLAAMKRELQQRVRENLSKHCYPRLIRFLDELPKTPSGKVQRFILKKSVGAS
jgi:acyl-coenzyme A synthetase/AMP-(fatty) acid ligase